MKKLYLCFFFYAAFSNALFAQTSGTNGYLPNYEPPSPEASALGKYVEHPVSTYTGTPKIEIPLFEIKTGRITLPISLSYHASGIKVDEIASRVGIGWVLNAGGVVTRTVKGWPDDVSGNYIDGMTKERGYFDNQVSGDQHSIITGGLIGARYTSNDLEPDIHYYNFAGKSGKFFFSDRSTAVSLSRDPIKISSPYNGVNKFVITSEDGLVYTFEATENTITTGGECTTSWYLTKILDPVTFKSVTLYYRTDMPTGFDYSTVLSMSYNMGCAGGGGNFNTIFTSLKYPKVLQKIVYDDGYIEFKADHSRQDLTGDRAYTEINQYVNDFTNTPVFRKGFNLTYAYTSNGTAQENYRLYLESVQEKGSDNSVLPPFSFTYKNRNQLPERLSVQQDIWGYYNANGASPGPYGYPPFPKIYVGGISSKAKYLPFNNNYSTSPVTIDGIERSSNPSTIDDGTLNKVTYPTGGYTTYVYEIHKFDNDFFSGGGTRIKQITDYSPTGNILLSKTYNYQNGLLGGPYPQVAFPVSIGSPATSSLVRFSQNQSILGSSQGSYVGYGSVVETQSGASGTNGSISYQYTTDQDVEGAFTNTVNGCPELSDLSGIRTDTYFPFFEMESREARRGALTQQAYFDANGKQIKAINYDYYLSSTTVGSVNSSYIIFDQEEPPFIIENLSQVRNLNAEKMMLNKKTETLYAGSSDTRDLHSISDNITAYNYTEGNYFDQFLRSETHFASNSGPIIATRSTFEVSPGVISDKALYSSNRNTQTTYKYPFDYAGTASGGVMGSMVSMNNISPVISTIKTSTVPSGAGEITYYTDVTVNDYKAHPQTGEPVPANIYKLNSIAPIQQYDPTVNPNSSVEVADPSAPGSLFENRINFNSYEVFGNLTSANLPGGTSVSYMWGYNKKKLIAEVKGAPATQVAYTSFEEWFDSDVGEDNNGTHISINNDNQAFYSNDAKTGKRSFLFGPGNYMETNIQLPPATYIVSYWSKGGKMSFDTYYIPSNTIDGTVDANGWQFHQVNLQITSPDYLEFYPDQSGSTINVDDIRVYPQGSQMTTYTYDPGAGLTSSTDAKNQITYYEYDVHNRLINVRDKNGNILKHTDYHYSGQ